MLSVVMDTPSTDIAHFDERARAVVDAEPDLGKLVREAISALRDTYGRHLRRVSVSVIDDPEAHPGDQDALRVEAFVALDRSARRELSRILRSGWWVSNSHRANGRLLLTDSSARA